MHICPTPKRDCKAPVNLYCHRHQLGHWLLRDNTPETLQSHTRVFSLDVLASVTKFTDGVRLKITFSRKKTVTVHNVTIAHKKFIKKNKCSHFAVVGRRRQRKQQNNPYTDCQQRAVVNQHSIVATTINCSPQLVTVAWQTTEKIYTF